LGGDTTTIISPLSYNDDKWHTIEASRDGKKSILKIDGEIIDSGVCNGIGTDLQVGITIYYIVTFIVIYLYIVSNMYNSFIPQFFNMIDV